VVIAGIVRTAYLSQVQSLSVDKTWLGFNVFVAGIAEGNLGIICACAPSLKSCFRVYFKDHFTSLGGTIRSKSPWLSEEGGAPRSTGSGLLTGTNDFEVSKSKPSFLYITEMDEDEAGLTLPERVARV